jgi:transposase-like protein
MLCGIIKSSKSDGGTKMGTLVEIIALAKEIPESRLGEALEKLREIKEQAESEKEKAESACPHCSSKNVVRNGHKHGKQAYLCRTCGKSYVATSKSAIEHSHSSSAVWKQVIRDTIDGVPLDKTAENLVLSHATAFNMRHKILYAVERSLVENPVALSGVCEADETYVLESLKGRKIPESYHRKARKHGAVAAKRGISDEYICVCTSVTGEAKNVSLAVNRATPSKEEILDIFGDRVDENTVLLCDGNKSYNALEDKCTIATTKRVNKVNGFHSFIKARLVAARGVATIYLNRYNALFSKVYASDSSVVDDIYALMTSQNGAFNSIAHSRSAYLLSI